MNRIEHFSLTFEKEILKKPFGFKGNALTQLWQVWCKINLQDGTDGTGLGVQSVLWADETVFEGHSETGANSLMISVTEYALKKLIGMEFTNPIEIQHKIFDDVFEYAKNITQNENLSETFVLNALVGLDFALWQIWAKKNKIVDFDKICSQFSPQMNQKQPILAEIPLIGYNTSKEEIIQLLKQGAFFLKIKIGFNPSQKNDFEKMCEWDIQRICEIHNIANEFDTQYTECKKPVYYLDANGRYPNKVLFSKLINTMKQKGILERVILIEEPFPKESIVDVSEFPVRIAGDESVHCAKDAVELVEKYHYGAITLKPIAKTLSVTFEIFNEMKQRNIPCFCADLTVPPNLLEWNMQVASRLEVLPGLKAGVLESNGAQNYKNWETLLQQHPVPQSEWMHPKKHLFHLSQSFYKQCAAFQIKTMCF